MTNEAENIEEISGIHLSYRKNDWVLRGSKYEWTLIPVVQRGEESENPGLWVIVSNDAKHFSRLKHMLPAMRKRAIAPIMNKNNRVTMETILEEIRNFHEWCKDNFKIEVKGENNE